MAIKDHVEVYAAADTQEAYFVRNLLEDAGIEAVVVGDAPAGAVGERSPFSSPPTVWVLPTDLEGARPIVEEYQRHLIERVESRAESEEQLDDEPPTEPFCYHCGQSVQVGQSPCPSCGQALDWGTLSGDTPEAGASP
ncbi:MAG: DUF2007 domain-containing protein [Planctomycetes bacterium]|nr:DUF2007 domain-containing protein [Planctomycetota bacterium]